MKRAILIFALTALFALLVVPQAHAVTATNALRGLGQSGFEAGYDVTPGPIGTGEPGYSIGAIVGIVLNSLLGLVGIAFLALVIYAGFMWMTAAGNDEQVKKAQSTLVNSAIGIAIVLGSMAIVNFIFPVIFRALSSS